MRLALVNDTVIGKELALPIYLSNGVVYANKGIQLTTRLVSILKGAGIDTVYIKDENDDVNIREIIKMPIRVSIINELQEVYEGVKKDRVLDEGKLVAIADKLIANLDISENSFLLNNIGRRSKDLELVQHSLNVAILSILVGITKGYSKEKLQKLAIGALLHDIGKLLGDEDNHCDIGYNFIKKNTHIPITSYMCILHHHEQEDGRGRPEGVAGEKLHDYSKIISVCNEYSNALQKGLFSTPSLALEYISSKVGSKFNSEIYKSFVDSVYCYPNGLYVRLSDGKEGVVVLQNKNFPTRPMIGVIEDGTPKIYNLLDNLSLNIEKVII